MNAELERLTRKHRAFLKQRNKCYYEGCLQPPVCRLDDGSDTGNFTYYCANHRAVIESIGTPTQPITTIERQYDRT